MIQDLTEAELLETIERAYAVKRAIPDLLLEARARGLSYPRLAVAAGVSHSSLIDSVRRATRRAQAGQDSSNDPPAGG